MTSRRLSRRTFLSVLSLIFGRDVSQKRFRAVLMGFETPGILRACHADTISLEVVEEFEYACRSEVREGQI